MSLFKKKTIKPKEPTQETSKKKEEKRYRIMTYIHLKNSCDTLSTVGRIVKSTLSSEKLGTKEFNSYKKEFNKRSKWFENTNTRILKSQIAAYWCVATEEEDKNE